MFTDRLFAMWTPPLISVKGSTTILHKGRHFLTRPRHAQLVTVGLIDNLPPREFFSTRCLKGQREKERENRKKKQPHSVYGPR